MQDTLIQEWAVAETAARRLEEGVSLNATLVVNTASGAEGEVKRFFDDASSLSALQQLLKEGGFAISAIRTARVFTQSAGQEDVFTCYDGVLSAGETDVDCGGVCSAKCKRGKTCVADEDCESGTCKEGVCKGWKTSSGLTVFIVIVVVVLVACVVIFVLVRSDRKKQKQASESKLKEIEMVKQQHEAEIQDLEKLDAKEEEEMKKLEKHLQKKQKKRANRQRGADQGSATVNMESVDAAMSSAVNPAASSAVNPAVSSAVNPAENPETPANANASSDHPNTASSTAPVNPVESATTTENTAAPNPSSATNPTNEPSSALSTGSHDSDLPMEPRA